MSRDSIGQSNSSEAVSGRIVEQHFVGCRRPYGRQLDGAWSVQNKLESAACSVLSEFKFRHGEMVLEEILFAAQRDMYK